MQDSGYNLTGVRRQRRLRKFLDGVSRYLGRDLRSVHNAISPQTSEVWAFLYVTAGQSYIKLTLTYYSEMNTIKFQEIAEKYKGEWVLIEYTELDDNLIVVDGEVVAHSMSKEDIYQAQLELKGKNLAIEYLGQVPEDWAAAL